MLLAGSFILAIAIIYLVAMFVAIRNIYKDR